MIVDATKVAVWNGSGLEPRSRGLGLGLTDAEQLGIDTTVSPDSVIGGAMWKLVMYATGGLLLWGYLKHRRGD